MWLFHSYILSRDAVEHSVACRPTRNIQDNSKTCMDKELHLETAWARTFTNYVYHLPLQVPHILDKLPLEITSPAQWNQQPVTRFWQVAFKLQKAQNLHKKISLIQTIRCRKENRTAKLLCGTCPLIASYSYLLTTQIYKVLPTIMDQTCHNVPLTQPTVYTFYSKLSPHQGAQIICNSLKQ